MFEQAVTSFSDYKCTRYWLTEKWQGWKEKKEQPVNAQKVGQSNDGPTISPRFFGIFRPYFWRNDLFPFFSSFIPSLSFFFSFFFTVADCLAHVGQAIIRTFVSRYRKWVYGFTHALPLNNNYYYYVPGYQSYGYRDPLSQITGTRWHVKWERGEFEKREENKRRRITFVSWRKCIWRNDNVAQKLHARGLFRPVMEKSLLCKLNGQKNWQSYRLRFISSGTYDISERINVLAKCTYVIFKRGYSSVAFMFDNFERYNWKYGSLWTLFPTLIWNRFFCSIVVTY